MTLDNATVQCIAGDGIDLVASANGVPTLTLTKSTIQNTQVGVHALAGTATISKSTIQYNYNGVEQDTETLATLRITGGKVPGEESR